MRNSFYRPAGFAPTLPCPVPSTEISRGACSRAILNFGQPTTNYVYAKIFRQIYDSSIAEDPELRFTFMDLLVLADSDGIVDMTHQALARITNRDLGVIKRTILQLENPDPSSRTPDESGARIKRLDPHRDWGWLIINYDRFRAIGTDIQRREAVRERVRRYRDKIRKPQKMNDVTPCNACVTPPYASASVSVPVPEGGTGGTPLPPLTNWNGHPEWDACCAWLAEAKRNGADYTEAETRSAWLALEANGWMWGRNPVVDWKAALERQIQTDKIHGQNKSQTIGPAGRKGFDRAAGTHNEGKAKLYDLRKIEAARALRDAKRSAP